jgi:hypothetical protein
MDTKKGMDREHSVHDCVWLKLLPQSSPQGMQTMHVLHSKPVNWCHPQRKGDILEASQNRYAKKAIETHVVNTVCLPLFISPDAVPQQDVLPLCR